MGKIRKAVFIISLIVFLVSAGYLLRYYMQQQLSERDFDSLKTEEGHDLAALHEQNPDIIGWISIEDTRIDYPVMWTPQEPEYYLRRNFKKESSMAGTPFLDGNSIMGTSQNYLIYGHNIKSGTMFHDLVRYDDQEFYKKHKIIRFDTLDGPGKYEIVSVMRTRIYNEDENVFKYYDYAYIDNAYTYDTYVQNVKAQSLYDTGVTPSYGEQLITLSTCEYSQEEGRYVVVARKIEER